MHACIWVFGHLDLEATLAPFCEDTEYLPEEYKEFADLTLSLKQEWDDPKTTTTVIVDQDGKPVCHVWDPRYLAPIDQEDADKRPIVDVLNPSFIARVEADQIWRAAMEKKYYHMQTRFKDGKMVTYGVHLPEGYSVKDVQVKEVYPKFHDFCTDYNGYDYSPDLKAYGYWYNPNAQWDWWSIGGRWGNTFPLKKDALPQITGVRPSDLSTFETIDVNKGRITEEKLRPKNMSDFCRATDIDWDKLYSDIRKSSSELYAKFTKTSNETRDEFKTLREKINCKTTALSDEDRLRHQDLIKKIYELDDDQKYIPWSAGSDFAYFCTGVCEEDFYNYKVASQLAPKSIITDTGQWIEGTPDIEHDTPNDLIAWWGTVSDHIRKAEQANDEERKLIAVIDIHF